MNIRTTLIVALACTLLTNISSAQTYSAHFLGTPDDTYQIGLNELGAYTINKIQSGVKFEDVHMNSFGQFAGQTLNYHAYSGTSSGLTDLQPVVGTYAQVWRVNDHGTMVGHTDSQIFDPRSQAFVVKGGVVTYLPSLGGGYGGAQAVSSNDLVAGHSWKGDNTIEGFLWDGNLMVDVGNLGGSHYFANTDRTFRSDAWGVNSAGTVVGISWLASGEMHGFAYFGGSIHDLGSLGGESSAAAVNDAGVIVGSAVASDSESHAAVWINSSLFDLNSITTGVNSNVYLTRAFELNSRGEILVTASDSSVYLLNPTSVPEPASFLCVIGGAAFAKRQLRHKRVAGREKNAN